MPGGLGGGGGAKVKETQASKILSQIGAQQWSDYLHRWKPVVGQANAMESQLGSETEREKLGGIATGGVEQKYGVPSQGFTGGEGAVSPLGIAAREVGRGTELGNATTGADLEAAAREKTGLENIIARGRGQQTQAVGGLQQAASAAETSELARAQLAQQSQAALLGGLGTVAGAGLGVAYNKYGGGPNIRESVGNLNQADSKFGLGPSQPFGGFGLGGQ